MAVAMKSENKGSFVRDFLSKHPEGNVKDVNEAWTAAGMEGTIGETLIYGTRADMGLSGKLRVKPKSKTSANAKLPAKMSKAASTPGKSMFAKEYLNDHPQGNVSAVNEAWQAAGFSGTVSATLVNKLRATMGLAGNLRGNTTKPKPSAPAAKQRKQQEKTTATAALSAQPRGNQPIVLEEMEADIDRLIFKAMAIGDLIEIEDTLRRARRLLYASLNRG